MSQVKIDAIMPCATLPLIINKTGTTPVKPRKKYVNHKDAKANI
jgi:hypothetical protein